MWSKKIGNRYFDCSKEGAIIYPNGKGYYVQPASCFVEIANYPERMYFDTFEEATKEADEFVENFPFVYEEIED